MKFYKNCMDLFNCTSGAIVYLGCVIPLMFFLFIKLFERFQVAGLVSFFWAIIIVCVLIGIYLLGKNIFYWLTFRKITFEISEDGIFYPYLLKKTRVIKWDEILNIKFEKNGGKDYIFIELADSAEDIGKFKKRFGFDSYFYSERGLRGEVLVVVQNAINGYQLQDFGGLLNAKWKKGVGRKPSAVTERILYNDGNIKPINFLYFIVLQLVIALVAMDVMGISPFPRVTNYKVSVMSCIFGIMLVIGCVLSICQLIIYYLIDRFKARVALEFDQQGVSMINDKIFSSVIKWEGVQSIELIDKTLRKNGYHQSFLEIKYVNLEGSIQKASIRNDLKDTSIYELYEVINNYKL